jgi:enterochelin esterase-like enzyme
MSLIRFEIVPPIAESASPVRIVGSLPALGDWDPARALVTTWSPPFHRASLEAETGVHFEYKIVRDGWESEAVDAYGNVPPNDVHEVWLDSTRHHTVADWKDAYRGRLTRETLHSRVLAGHRDLMIWLPQGYSNEPTRRFPVVVLHDGDNVFDPRTSPLTGIDWAADEWVHLLASQGVLPEAIVVGVCHPDGFSEENETLRDFDLSPELGGAAYAQFLVGELIPHMDAHYRTLAEPAARVLCGADLGGLLTFFVALHHPGVFARFACLSTAFEDVSKSVPTHAGQLLALEALPAVPPGIKLFFDYGTKGLDECYDPYHRDLAGLLRAKGLRDDVDFRILRVEGAGHDELSWRQRFGEALRFLAK